MHTEKNQPESALKQTKTDRVRRSYSEWEALVSEWERSNQSQKAFCESKKPLLPQLQPMEKPNKEGRVRRVIERDTPIPTVYPGQYRQFNNALSR